MPEKNTVRKCEGFTLVEIMVSLTLGLLVMSLVFEIFMANHRSLKMQIDLATLESRMHRVTDILRHDIQLSKGKVTILNNELMVNEHRYFTENNFLIMENNHRKSRIVGDVSEMTVTRYPRAIDITLHIVAGSLGKTMHVFTALN